MTALKTIIRIYLAYMVIVFCLGLITEGIKTAKPEYYNKITRGF